MRKSRTAPFDLSIRGDEQENHRIMLEHNLRNTDLDIHLSSTSDEEGGGAGHRKTRRSRRSNPNDSSMEYPRHMSDPAAFPEFPSFARSRDLGDDDMHMHSGMHGWSYRTGDDDEGVNPYGGESLSTAAHHASAVTIGAGLGGGRGARREPSLSGAEYDPERPLSGLIAGVTSKHTMLDPDSKYHHTADPVIVDSTIELDRILESGHAQPSMRSRSVRLISPLPSSSSASSDSDGGQSSNMPGSPRPRLADHLNQTFSPKRPRSALPGTPGSPLGRQRSLFEDELNMPTPRPSKFATNMSSTPAQPQVRLQPATPSSAAGHSRVSRNRSNVSVHHASIPRPSSAPPERNPFQDSIREEPKSVFPSRRTPGRGASAKVYLPDVTGLTQAVESPAKPGLEYMRYRGDDRPRDSEARLLQTLGAVQSKLRDLEEENGISRRRVHELELELEEAKREVKRERTRLIEREELSFQPAQAGKGNSRAQNGLDLDDKRLHERYKEAVEEKKALEALVNSLRSHLTRLTTELASHKELLAELRRLREEDAKALKEKTNEINLLRREVERLAGEVEVLRGVVEEGLKERRASRDIQFEHSRADTAMSHDSDEEGQDQTEEEEEQEHDEETDDGEPFDDVGSARAHSPAPHMGDKTQRTDFATLGSSQFADSVGPPVVTNEEIQRITAEVQERRTNMSNISMADLSLSRSRSPSPAPAARLTTVAEEDEDTVQFRPRRTEPAPSSPRPPPSTSAPPRPSAPTPKHAARQAPRPSEDVPFPQIRGEQLEKLFFSAPEHNAHTCTVCYRRRHRQTGSPPRPSWSAKAELPPQARTRPRDDADDEGFAEDSDGGSPDLGHPARQKGKEGAHARFTVDVEHWRQAGTRNGLPPQTVLARVIRELEDDFSHYKSVYIELADQYKVMDAASDVSRRNTLANHLREVVDILEQKGDQIAALYDLLSFKDKPLVATGAA